MKTYSRNQRSHRYMQTIPLLIAGLVLIGVAALVSCSDTLVAPEESSFTADRPQSDDAVGQRLEQFLQNQSTMSPTEQADALIPLMFRVMNGRSALRGTGFSTPTMEKLTAYRDELLQRNADPTELEKLGIYIQDEEAKAADQGQTLHVLDRHYQTILEALNRIDKPTLEKVLVHRQRNHLENNLRMKEQLQKLEAGGKITLEQSKQFIPGGLPPENDNALRHLLGLPPAPALDPAAIAAEMNATPDQDTRTPVEPTVPRSFTPPPPPSDTDVFIIVEEMPKLVGGLEALQQELEYPTIAKEAGIEGNVIVQFVVDKEGRVMDPKVVKGIGGGCDEEALRVVETIQFTPGRQRGEAVNVKFSLPVRFQLSSAP